MLLLKIHAITTAASARLLSGLLGMLCLNNIMHIMKLAGYLQHACYAVFRHYLASFAEPSTKIVNETQVLMQAGDISTGHTEAAHCSGPQHAQYQRRIRCSVQRRIL